MVHATPMSRAIRFAPTLLARSSRSSRTESGSIIPSATGGAIHMWSMSLRSVRKARGGEAVLGSYGGQCQARFPAAAGVDVGVACSREG